MPINEITTYHLALLLDFADLHETLGIPMLGDQPDVLGAIWVDTETILIDRSLDPKRNPAMGGRYRFSVAHEVGHWRLHRSYVCEIASNFDPTPNKGISLIVFVKRVFSRGRNWTRKWTHLVPVFYNNINTVRDFRGGVKVGRDFTFIESQKENRQLAERRNNRGAGLVPARVLHSLSRLTNLSLATIGDGTKVAPE